MRNLKSEPIIRLGQILQAIRKQKLGSRAEVVRRLKKEYGYHINQSTIGYMETGQSEPTLKYLEYFFELAYGRRWKDDFIAAMDLAYRGRP